MPEKRIMKLSCQAGELLLKNGAEVNGVQKAMTGILDAYAIKNYSVYVIANCIFTSVNDLEDDSYCSICQVPIHIVHLGRIAAINKLCIQIMEQPDSDKIEYYWQCLRKAGHLPFYDKRLNVAAGGVGSSSFCIILGGSLLDSLFAMISGVMLKIFLYYMNKEANTFRYIPTIIGATIVSSFAILISLTPLTVQLDSIIIGSIITLVPGVAFTTAIYDYFNGDYLSGNIHIVDALLTGISIAVGVGASLYFADIVVGHL